MANTNMRQLAIKSLLTENHFILDDDRNSDTWSDFVEFMTDPDEDGNTQLDTVLGYVPAETAHPDRPNDLQPDLRRKIVVSLLCEAFMQGYSIGEAVGRSEE